MRVYQHPVRNPGKYEAVQEIIKKAFRLDAGHPTGIKATGSGLGRLHYNGRQWQAYLNACADVDTKHAYSPAQIQAFLANGTWGWQADDHSVQPARPLKGRAASNAKFFEIFNDEDLPEFYDILLAECAKRRIDPVRRTIIKTVETEVPL